MQEPVDVPVRSRGDPGPPPSGVEESTAIVAATVMSPILVGLAAVTWVWSQNRAEFEASVVVRPAVAVAAGAVLLILIFRLLTGRLGAASLLASLTLVAILGYGTVVDVIDRADGRDSMRAQMAIRVLDVVALGLAIVVVIWLAAPRPSVRACSAVPRASSARPSSRWRSSAHSGRPPELSLGLDGAGPGLVDGGDGGATTSTVDEAPVPRPVPVLAHDDASHSGCLLRDPRRVRAGRRSRHALLGSTTSRS